MFLRRREDFLEAHQDNRACRWVTRLLARLESQDAFQLVWSGRSGTGGAAALPDPGEQGEAQQPPPTIRAFPVSGAQAETPQQDFCFQGRLEG